MPDNNLFQDSPHRRMRQTIRAYEPQEVAAPIEAPPEPRVNPFRAELERRNQLRAELKQRQGPPTLERRAQETFGFDPTLKRGSILPMARTPEGEMQFAWPQAAVDVARSALLPGHVMKGGQYTPTDVTKMALDVGMPAHRAPGARPTPLTRGQAVRQAPTREALRKESSALYKDIRARGAVVPGEQSKKLVDDLGTRFVGEGADDVLHPKAVGILERWRAKTGNARDLGFDELEIMRKQAGMVAKSTEPSEARLGIIMKEHIDDYMDTLPEGTDIKRARELWRRNAKLQDIEEAFFKAENAASGFETGLRNSFRALLNNKKLRRNYNKAEISAMRKVVNGGPIRAFMRTVRHLGPSFSGENRFLGYMLGGGAGYAAGGPIGAAATMGAGSLAGRLARGSTTNAARLAEALVASGGRMPPTRSRALGLLERAPGPLLGAQIPDLDRRRSR